MKTIIRNILALLLGWIAGSVVNMGLVYLGSVILPLPAVDSDDMDALAKAMPHMNPEFFVFPFAAHALGTLVGSFVCARIAFSQKMVLALAIGVLFLIGGIAVTFMLPAPLWFVVLDLALAYLPMAWIGGFYGRRQSAFKKLKV